MDNNIKDLIYSKAEELDVPPEIALAVAEQESGFDQSRVGSKGEIGVFQLLPAAAKDAGIEDRSDLPQNIQGGISYLKQMHKATNDWGEALKAYNGGIGNYQKGTVSSAAKNYSSEVLTKAKKYKPAEDEEEAFDEAALVAESANKSVPAAYEPEPLNMNVPANGKGFASVLLQRTNQPDFYQLPFVEQATELSKIYNAKPWQKEAYPIFKDIMNNLWEGAKPDDLPDIPEFVGSPPVSQHDPKKETEAWRNQVVQDLLGKKISPAIFGNHLDEYLDKASKDEVDAFTVRNRGYIASAANWAKDTTREVVKGGATAVLSPVAGAIRLLTPFNETADVLEHMPTDYLGTPSNAYLYQTNEIGRLKMKDGQPIPKWQADAAQLVGNVGTFLAGGFAAKAVGYTSKAIFGGMYTANTLSIGNEIYKDVLDKTGSVAQAYTGAMFAFPASLVGSTAELGVISKTAEKFIQGFGTYNKAKAIANVLTHGAIGAAGMAGLNAIEQVGKISQTGEEFKPGEVGFNALIGGGVSGVLTAATSRKPSTRGTPEEQIISVKNLEDFQKAPQQELVIPNGKAATIPPDALNTLGMEAVKGEHTTVIRKKSGYVPMEPAPDIEGLTKQIEMLQTSLEKDGIPDEIFAETGKRLTKAREEHDQASAAATPEDAQNAIALEELDYKVTKAREVHNKETDPAKREATLANVNKAVDDYRAYEKAHDVTTEAVDLAAKKAVVREIQDELGAKTVPTFANDISLKHSNLARLIANRDALVKEIQAKQAQAAEKPKAGEAPKVVKPQSAEEVIAENTNKTDLSTGVPVGKNIVSSINGKWYVSNKKGEVISKPHDYYAGAAREARHGPVEVKVESQGTGGEVPPLEPEPPAINQYIKEHTKPWLFSKEEEAKYLAQQISHGKNIKLIGANEGQTIDNFNGSGLKAHVTRYKSTPNDVKILLTEAYPEDPGNRKIVAKIDISKGELKHLAVGVDYQKKGIGTALIKEAQKYVVDKISLPSENVQEGAVRAYVRANEGSKESVGAMKAENISPLTTTQRVGKSPEVDELIREGVGGKEGLVGYTQSHQVTERYATQFIAEHGGIQGATSVYLNMPLDVATPELIYTGRKLLDFYNAKTKAFKKEGDLKGAQSSATLAVQVTEKAAEMARLAGQTVEASKIFAQLDPDTLITHTDAALQLMKLPGLTDADKARITELMGGAKTSGGVVQQNYIRKVNDIIFDRTHGAFYKGKSPLFTLWQAFQLSDPSTQIVNGVGNISQLMGSALSFIVTGVPKGNFDGFAMLKGIVKGAINEGVDAAMLELRGIRTYGRDETKFDLSARGVLKGQTDFVRNAPTWMKKLGLNNFGLVFRGLSATDAFFSKSAYNGMANLAAYKAAIEEGITNKAALRVRVAELLNDSPQAYTKAFEQAKGEVAEALKLGVISKKVVPRLEKLRAWEIVEESRNKDIREESQKFASKSTFNQTPDGIVGELTNFLGRVASKPITMPGGKEVRPLEYVFPFMRVAGNIANAMLDYTPAGAYRAKYDSKLTNLEKRNTLGKFIIGTTLGSVLYSMAKQYEDDKDPYFALYSTGPKDLQQRKIWQQQGGKDHSLKMGDRYFRFAEHPIGGLLGGIAAVLNAERYDPKFKGADPFNKVFLGIGGAMKSFTDISFLKSIGTTVKAITDGDADLMEGLVISPVKGFAFGGIGRRVAKLAEDPIDTKNNFMAKLFYNIPFASLAFKPAINVLGKPVGRTDGERLGALDRFYGERTNSEALQWLAESGYALPNQGVSVAGTKALKNKRIEEYGAMYGGVLTPEENYEVTLKAGPLIEKRILQYKATYGNKPYSEDVAKRFKDDIAHIRSRVRRDVAIPEEDPDAKD